jgi:hypothetical protein
MAHILHSIMGSKTIQTIERDAQGVESTVEKAAPVVKEVTFMLDRHTPHTLKFLDQGTLIKDGRGVERVIGDAETVYHEFTTEADAVAAFLDGKV